MQRYNIRLQVCVDVRSWSYLVGYMQKNNLKNESQAIRKLIREFQDMELTGAQATERLNKVIQGYEEKIRNLEFENRMLRQGKIIKEGVDHENKSK